MAVRSFYFQSIPTELYYGPGFGGSQCCFDISMERLLLPNLKPDGQSNTIRVPVRSTPNSNETCDSSLPIMNSPAGISRNDMPRQSTSGSVQAGSEIQLISKSKDVRNGMVGPVWRWVLMQRSGRVTSGKIVGCHVRQCITPFVDQGRCASWPDSLQPDAFCLFHTTNDKPPCLRAQCARRHTNTMHRLPIRCMNPPSGRRNLANALAHQLLQAIQSNPALQTRKSNAGLSFLDNGVLCRVGSPWSASPVRKPIGLPMLTEQTLRVFLIGTTPANAFALLATARAGSAAH